MQPPFPGARLVSQFGKGLAGICLQIPSPPPPLHEVTPKLLQAVGKGTVGLAERNLQLKSWPFLAGGNAAQTSVRMGIHSLHPEPPTPLCLAGASSPCRAGPLHEMSAVTQSRSRCCSVHREQECQELLMEWERWSCATARAWPRP